jgi:hypothetical protein
MKRLLIALTAALAFSAQAQFINGNRLYERLTGSSHGNTMWAIGYITGVADAYNGELFCVPQTVTVGQIKDITEQLLVARPQDRHLPADILIMFALVDVFPCKKGSGT